MKLYPHQVNALEDTFGMNRVAYYHDMGLGKTFTGSEKMNALGGRVNLIICQKSKIDDWTEHFKEYYSYVRDFTYNLSDKVDYSNFKNHAEMLMGNRNLENCYGVINYDLIFRRPELLKIKYDTIMLDESSIIQNRTSKRSKAILKLKTDNVILLSGTPTGGRYERLWSQLHLLGWDISEDLFYRQYVDYHFEDNEGFPRRVIDGYKNVDRLKEKLRHHGAHFLKTEEVFDLPEQIFQEVRVPVSKEYKKFEKSRIVTVNGVEFVGDTALTNDLYKRQLCGAFNEHKLKALEDILESTDERVIVFYNFNYELRAIEDICIKLDKPMSIVNGQTKDLACFEEYNNSVVAIQYVAGSMGLNLQKANRIVYFTPPTMSELYEQSKKRIHRIGQNQTCFYYNLICAGSVEERVYERLKERKDYTDALF